MEKLKLVIDENISFAEEVFSQFGEIKLINGREINNGILKDADILLVRSLTKVNANLLKGTKVKFVGTATIGIDHIDLEYLNKNNIVFADSKGCNADAVTEYVFNTLINLCCEKNIELSKLSIGIIGIGNIGSRVANLSNALGIKTFLNDPPLERTKNNRKFSSIEECLSTDIITFHTPLNRTGIDKTYHLFNKEKIKFVKDDAIFINTSRGEVVETQALLKLIDEKNINAIIDVWENEPLISEELLSNVKIGTPHIAGYSFEGKLNGTKMLFNALNKFLNTNYYFPIKLPIVENNIFEISSRNSIEEILKNIFNKIYDIKEDDIKLRKILSLQLSGESKNPNLLMEKKKKYFDDLRKNYPMRREFINYQIHLNPFNENITNILKSFRFTII